MHLSIEHNETVEIKEKTARSTLKKPNVKRRKKSANICEICCKTFSGMGSLKIHIASIHEGKKPFKCNICDYSCNQKSDLTKHVLSVHEGKKSFKCNICDAGFTHKANLNKQIDAVHKEKKKFKGTICDKVFSQIRDSIS